MIYGALGTTSYEVARIGLAFRLPLRDDPQAEPVDENESIASIQTALDLGMNYLEVGPFGGANLSEAVVAKALQGRRERVILAAVCGQPERAGNGGSGPRYERSDRIVAACEEGLRRLRIEAVDLFYCHVPTVVAPVSEIESAFAKLLARGDVRAVGLSNASCALVNDARRLGPLHAVRAGFSLFETDPGTDVAATCREHRLGFFAYDPLCRERLSGRYYREAGNAPIPANAAAARGPRWQADAKAVDALTDLAAGAGRTVAQLSLSWLLGRSGVTSAVVETARPSQVREYAEAAAWSLTDDVIQRVNDILQQRARELDR